MAPPVVVMLSPRGFTIKPIPTGVAARLDRGCAAPVRMSIISGFFAMRGLDESTEVLIRVGQTAGERVKQGLDAFVNFAARDNVLEVALGLMLDSLFLSIFSFHFFGKVGLI